MLKYIVFIFLFVLNASATLNNVDKANLVFINQLVNPGFENGQASWTVSGGTFTTVASGSNLLAGAVSATWNSSGAAQTLTSSAATIRNGLYGQNGLAQCRFQTPSGTATHTIGVWDGTTLTNAQTIISSTLPTVFPINFIYPSSGTLAIRITSVNADEPLIAIDDCYLGIAANLSNVSQASFVGGMDNPGAGTCQYSQNTSTSVSNLVDLGAGSGCAAWTVVSNGPGTISAQGTNDHRLVYTNMPPGNYQFILTGGFGDLTGAVATNMIFRMSDGTNNFNCGTANHGTNSSSLTPALTCHATYTTAGTRTFKIQAADSAATTIGWWNYADLPVSWKIYRFPTSSEIAVNSLQGDFGWTSFSPTVGGTTTAPGEGAGVVKSAQYKRVGADMHIRYDYRQTGAGTAGSGAYLFPLPSGLTIDTTKARVPSTLPTASVMGIGSAQVGFGNSGTTSGGDTNFWSPITIQVFDSSNLYAITIAGSALDRGFPLGSAAAIAYDDTVFAYSFYAIVPILQWQENQRAPTLVGSVTSGSSGAVKVEGGQVNCAAASTIGSRSSSWFTIGNRVSNTCAITFTAGTFSGTPFYCAATFDLDQSTNLTHVNAYSISSIGMTIGCKTQSGITTSNCSDFTANLFCMGPR